LRLYDFVTGLYPALTASLMGLCANGPCAALKLGVAELGVAELGVAVWGAQAYFCCTSF
jgi:hypothetical protein